MPKKHIHIISPSGVVEPILIDQASQVLISYGYEVSEGQYAREKYGRFAGTKEQRLNDLINALTNPEYDIVLCSRGGYGLQEIITQLDSALLFRFGSVENIQKGNLPLLVGFSDITVLHQLYARYGHRSLHAMMCKGIAQAAENNEDAIKLWSQAIEDNQQTYNLTSHALNRVGQVTGTLIGGNLSVLYGLQDTQWSLKNIMSAEQRESQTIFDKKKHILFIEDISERHYHIERMMLNLKMSGVFNQIGGLIVGQMTDCQDDPSMGCTVYETIANIVADYSFPILFSFPAGHDIINNPLQMGTLYTMNVNNNFSQLIC